MHSHATQFPTVSFSLAILQHIWGLVDAQKAGLGRAEGLAVTPTGMTFAAITGNSNRWMSAAASPPPPAPSAKASTLTTRDDHLNEP